mgnify:CR=1 FL=1
MAIDDTTIQCGKLYSSAKVTDPETSQEGIGNITESCVCFVGPTCKNTDASLPNNEDCMCTDDPLKQKNGFREAQICDATNYLNTF